MGQKRILIVGRSGAGKSTLARRLGETLALPVIHLDSLFWNPGWVQTPWDEFEEKLLPLLRRPAWIMDGNYSRTLALRLRYCDTVIFLDLPRAVCMRAIFRRFWRYRGKTRPDMPENCPERLDWAFVRLTWTYDKRSRPEVLELLRQAQGVAVHTCTDFAQVDALVEEMRRGAEH